MIAQSTMNVHFIHLSSDLSHFEKNIYQINVKTFVVLFWPLVVMFNHIQRVCGKTSTCTLTKIYGSNNR